MTNDRPVRVGLMGFGRTGRQIFELASHSDDIEVVAIADIGDPSILHYLLCAEVNTEPPNPRSLRFHDLFGFDMVAQFEPTGSPEYRVGMMVKKL